MNKPMRATLRLCESHSGPSNIYIERSPLSREGAEIRVAESQSRKEAPPGTGPPPGVIGTWCHFSRRFPTPRIRSEHIVRPSRVL